MTYLEVARDNYKRFSTIEGNEFIASEYALTTIMRLIEDFKVKSVLEVGLGIGSISDTILKKHPEIKYTGTEAEPYCLTVLPKNVVNYEKIAVFNDLSQPASEQYDLIIVDGSDASLAEIKRFCHDDTILFIEGFRGEQVAALKQIFPKSMHAEVISSRRNPEYGPFPATRWGGGGQLIFINPDLYKKYYWFKEKVRSFIVRRMRKFKK